MDSSFHRDTWIFNSLVNTDIKFVNERGSNQSWKWPAVSPQAKWVRHISTFSNVSITPFSPMRTQQGFLSPSSPKRTIQVKGKDSKGIWGVNIEKKESELADLVKFVKQKLKDTEKRNRNLEDLNWELCDKLNSLKLQLNEIIEGPFKSIKRTSKQNSPLEWLESVYIAKLSFQEIEH